MDGVVVVMVVVVVEVVVVVVVAARAVVVVVERGRRGGTFENGSGRDGVTRHDDAESRGEEVLRPGRCDGGGREAYLRTDGMLAQISRSLTLFGSASAVWTLVNRINTNHTINGLLQPQPAVPHTPCRRKSLAPIHLPFSRFFPFSLSSLLAPPPPFQLVPFFLPVSLFSLV